MKPAPAGPVDAKTYRQYRVPSVERMLALVEILASEPGGLTQTELVERLKFSKVVIFRLSVTLIYHGYLEKDPVTHRLTLTRKVLALGHSSIGQYNLIEEALPLMRQLRDATTETVQLNTYIGIEGLVLEQVPALHEIRIVVDPGTRFGLHCSAPGKAILAFMPEREREKILQAMAFPRHSPTTFTDLQEFRRELQRVRQVGYGVDQAEGIVVGLHCISAPVLDRHGFPVGALTVTAPAARLPVEHFSRTARDVVRYADELSYKLGYQVLCSKANMQE